MHFMLVLLFQTNDTKLINMFHKKRRTCRKRSIRYARHVLWRAIVLQPSGGLQVHVD